MKLQLTLASRYLRGRPLRTALTTLAVVFGVMIVFGMNGITPAVRASFEESVRLSAHEVDLVITPTDGQPFDARLAGAVRETPGVAAVTAVLERSLILPDGYRLAADGDRPIEAVMVNGWEPDTSREVVPIDLLAGRWLEPGDAGAALVRESFVERSGLGLGDRVRLPAAVGEATFEIVGILSSRPLFGDEEVYLPLPAAQALFDLPGKISAMAGQIAPGSDEEAVRRAVSERLGPGFALGAVQAGGREWDSVLRIAEVVFTLFGVLALAMGGFIVFNTFRTGVAERRRDIGMLRAVGASRRTVMGMVLAEGLLLGAVGTAVGMLLGFAAVHALLPLISPTWERFFGAPLGAPAFSPWVYAVSIGLGLGIPLLSGLPPALAASRVAPLEALRPPAGETTWRGAGRRAAAGVALIALALASLVAGDVRLVALGALLFLIGLMLVSAALVHPIAVVFGRILEAIFAREGHLAQRNLTRQPARAAVTASAIMLSLAILVALAGLATTFTSGLLGYLERSMQADYLLLPEALILGQSNAGAGPDLARRVGEIPGIAAVTTVRRGSSQIGETATQVVGLDPASYPQVAGLVFTAGEPERAFAQLAEGRFVIVNSLLAAQGRIAPGQTVELQTPAGAQTYEVVGVGADYLNSRVATVYISQANLAEDFGVTDDVLLMANRDPSAPAGVVEDALLGVLRDYPAFSLLSYESWRQEQVAANQTRTNILYVLMALLAIPSLLALANTLGINVLERTREIGTLRAIGSTRAQVRRVVLAESLLLSAMGTGLGILAGIWLGYALVGTMSVAGFLFAYTFPGLGIVVAAAVGLLFGVLAALLPARRAARLNIVAALRYDS